MHTKGPQVQARPLKKKKWPISSSLIIGIFVALGLVIAGYLVMPAGLHFQLFRDEQSFCRVMSQQVHAGMTLNQVQDLLVLRQFLEFG